MFCLEEETFAKQALVGGGYQTQGGQQIGQRQKRNKTCYMLTPGLTYSTKTHTGRSPISQTPRVNRNGQISNRTGHKMSSAMPLLQTELKYAEAQA